ncbi:phage major capsid protein [Castellaniella ginsengisoli]|uniref:Phage major capsid protein n=1 Tax=Castellaniella ginsengisoli TaxID=546114 RepID=A0AB39EQS6_9BURK
MKTFAEQVAALKATREKKFEDMKGVAQKSVDESRSMDTAEQEEFDTLQGEIKRLDDDIKRLSVLADMDRDTAKPVDGTTKAEQPVRGGAETTTLRVKSTQKLEPGIAFARLARVKALAHTGAAGTRDEVQIAQSLYKDDDGLVKALMAQKAAVSAANTGDSSWAGNLINEGGVAFADFVEYLRPRTLYGQISARFRSLPFDVPVLVQNSGGTAQWTKEGSAKPVTSWGYSRTKIQPLKVTAIAAATNEMLDRASASADALIRDELARAVGVRIDGTLISAAAAVPDESPAGLLNGTGATPLTGDGTVFGIRCDIATMMKAMVANNLSVAGCFWVMPETTAVDLALATNEVGAPAFPGMTPTGGTLAGLPVYTSQYVPIDSTGASVALVRGDEIYLGDEGGLIVKASDQASILMADNPTMDSTTPTAAQLVSMWQTNSTAFLVERFLNWEKRRSQALVWAKVNWNACADMAS